MWVRLKPEEMEENNIKIKARRKRVFKESFQVGLFCLTVVIVLKELTGHFRYSLHWDAPQDLQEVISSLPICIAISAAISLIFAFICSHRDDNEVVCLKCERTWRSGGDMICECGGTLELRDKVKWVDHNS